MAVAAKMGFVCADMNWRPTAAIVAETWPQFLEAPTPAHHAGWQQRHDQRSRAMAAACRGPHAIAPPDGTGRRERAIP